MYKLVAAILVGNGVGGRMATAPHYNTVVVILNNVKRSGIPLCSEILCYMWYTLALMDLMMVRVDRNMLSYCTYTRHPVIRTRHLLCLTVIK